MSGLAACPSFAKTRTADLSNNITIDKNTKSGQGQWVDDEVRTQVFVVLYDGALID